MNGYAMRNQLKTVYQSHDISDGQKWIYERETHREREKKRETHTERERQRERQGEREKVKTDHAFFGFL